MSTKINNIFDVPYLKPKLSQAQLEAVAVRKAMGAKNKPRNT